MATIAQLPSEAIISAFKGKVDFYLWKGLPCARKWPHWPKRAPNPLERTNQQSFSYINRIAGALPEYIKDQFRRMAAGTPFTWKDLLVRAYMKGINY